MFKRVDKRRRKKEEEEKLGLDEEVKEILGIQDTDSEESESESDSDEDEGSAADEGMDGENGDEDEDEGEGEDDLSITVSQALKDPLYIVSIDPDVKACIVCPGKLLKSIKMVQLHRTSNAHIRRFKQFSDASADTNSNDNACQILKRNSENKSRLSLTTSGVSKRAEKKKASQARRKARREEAKEKARVKKLKTTSENTPPQLSETPGSANRNSPPKKKQKIDMVQSTTPPSAAAKTSKTKESAKINVTSLAAVAPEDNDDTRRPPHIQDSVKIQDIVKSTSNRAKTARSRALSMSKKTSRLTKSAVA